MSGARSRPGAVLLEVSESDWDPGPWVRALKKVLPGRRVLTDGEGLEANDAVYALVWKPSAERLKRLHSLRAIFSLGAGVDHILDVGSLPDVPIVRIVADDLTARMTEYVVWQVLHHHRQAFAYAAQHQAHDWRGREQPAAAEVTVGVMGFGTLGQHAGQRLSSLGFRVVGWRRSAAPVAGFTVYGSDNLGAFLAETDILVSLLPLTPQTRGMVDRDLLARLRPDGPLGGPVFINAGRGGTQVEADIIDALRQGSLLGASLDVFAKEPLPPGDPLWTTPRLVITPHVAAASDPDALSSQIAEQIAAFEAGRPLIHLVDPQRGY